MSRIGRLGKEIVERIKNKINSGAINNRSTQRTIETLNLQQESSDTFEKLSSNGALIDVSLEMHEDMQEGCEEFMDDYAYNPQYEKEHSPTVPKEVLNIIA